MNNGHIMITPPRGDLLQRTAPGFNKRNLYVGGLDQQINEQILQQIFETAGHVISVKVIPEKGVRKNTVSLKGDFSALRMLWVANMTRNSADHDLGTVRRFKLRFH
jgi:hypothetical protein